ncbi:hypothetical protein N7G274_001650 [Stereocaulon virgatum]|uniref:Uncharacterized protein n=1 Tax=Stereocaulon virgatum TaxID=373712 RepID=A0ABR4AM59_9LECA
MALPILRNATRRQGVIDKPPLKRTFDRILKLVLHLSGYFRNAAFNAIRRYLGKKAGIPKSNNLNISTRLILMSTAKAVWPTPRLSAGNPLFWMKSPNMTTSTIPNPLRTFAKRAFPLNYQPKNKMPSGEIHNFWHLNPKSSGLKDDEALRTSLKLPKAKLGRVKSACVRKSCGNTSLNGYGSGGLESQDSRQRESQ